MSESGESCRPVRDSNPGLVANRRQKPETGTRLQFLYDLDVDKFEKQAARLYNASKQLSKYQPEIHKKQKKQNIDNYTSKRLVIYKDIYQSELEEAEKSCMAITNLLNRDTPKSGKLDSPTRERAEKKQKREHAQDSRDRSWEVTMWREKHKKAEEDRDEYVALYISLKDQVERLNQDLARLKEDNAKLRMRMSEREKEIRDLQSDNASRLRNYRKEKAEKDEALTSLSAVRKTFLDDKPNIAYLIDVNRPTKIAEQLSELYDNEWTDAFDSLEKRHPGIDSVQKLVNILKVIYEQCLEMAWEDFFPRVQYAIDLPAKVLQEFKPFTRLEYEVALTKEMKQYITEFRKRRVHINLPIIQRLLVPKNGDSDELRPYYNKCVEVCWLAAVQDPPLFMNFNPGAKFDTTLFKDYTTRGPYVEFLVWPALYLHKDGPLLSKGVAQGTLQSRGVQGYTTQDSVGGRRAADRPESVDSRDHSWEVTIWRERHKKAEEDRDRNMTLYLSLKDQVERLQKGQDDLKGEKAKLRQELSEREKEIKYLQSENASLLQNYKQEKADKDDALTRLKERLSELERERENTRLLRNNRQEKAEKDDVLTRISVVASSKIRDNNPNIADLADVNRPTKIAEKMSELYDNEWTDAFDNLEKSHPDIDVVQILVNILKNINEQCIEMAWQDYFRHVQSAIELPAKILQELKPSTHPVNEIRLTKEFQQQIKEFRKLRAPTTLPIIQTALVPKDFDSDELRAYYNRCVEVCWLAAVQDPPMFMNFNPGVNFDTTLFKDYTARGPFVEFLVWPALNLHKDGPLLSKGVAQGTRQSRGVQVYTRRDSVGGRRAADRPATVAVKSSKIRDNNPNIADLSDVNRPTKIAEKMSELYDNEWTDAFDSLEKSNPGLDVVKTLLDILKTINSKCQEMSRWQVFIQQVQSAIELPAKVLKKTKPDVWSNNVYLPEDLQQMIKHLRKLKAPFVLHIIQSELLPKDVDSDELRAYYNRCVEVCWLAAVQDPPLFMNFNAGEKFDTTLFKDYTAKGPYVEFLVWPALHLHDKGPLLSKGVAQGSHAVTQPQGFKPNFKEQSSLGHLERSQPHMKDERRSLRVPKKPRHVNRSNSNTTC
ncbi:uncharacterized protein LOC127877239 isoform X2 [Dreissena polymorpha]|uniref:uncharacterized protein LOC127877239 isoform X2 n=1 Tax=Dreissena polymorpha TaxID=45954 RepID=UPI002264E84B|nr:uncharacterized protein LOC127877239 isoform X2 [Dreissena polymorpha]